MENENSQSRVMIVDDTPANLGLLEDILRSRNYDVASFPSGALALRAASQYPPDIILLDIMMPDMDGFEVCMRLKADAALREIPVIFISALDDTENKVKAFTEGGLDYVTKPFQTDEVLARVRTHLFLRHQQLEIEAQKQKIQHSLEELQQLERQRDALVHMVVHDMRSPLMSIMLAAELLEMNVRKTGDEDSLEGIDDILASSRHIREMITTLLDISRMESNEMPLNLESCDLHEVLGRSVSSLKALVRKANLIYEPSGKAVMAYCDKAIMQRVVENLLANAVKYAGEKGSIRLELTELDDEVRISVHDSGPGIPKEYHQMIFDKFGQVSAEQNCKTHSTGLGLAFCKIAVEAQGGRIGVESEVGKGSTFWLTLPRKEKEQLRTPEKE
jgi:two-component system sensor histidine kinase/response regulator